jgi:hypothetical protein
MGGYLYLLLKSLVESDTKRTTNGKGDTNGNGQHLPAFVFGDEGEFLGRVDVPVLTGSEKGN